MRYAKGISRILALIPILALCSICTAQSAHDQRASEKIAAQVESIVHRAATPLDLSDPSSPVQISSSQIFFEPKDIAEVRSYGPEAVPALTKFLLNKNTRVERVAIRLLGVIGGPAVTGPLLEVLEKSTSALSRNEALLNLKQSPCTKAVAHAIFRAAKNDADATVREQAQAELSWCSDETR